MKIPTISRKWKSISVIIVGMFGLSTLSFNCAPSLFQAASYNLSSTGLGIFSLDNIQSKYSLLSAEQSYQTMLNVTGQNLTGTAGRSTNRVQSTLQFVGSHQQPRQLDRFINVRVDFGGR